MKEQLFYLEKKLSMRNEMNKIFEIKLPEGSDTDFINLFVRQSETYVRFKNESEPAKMYSFDTWMNAFAGRKYAHFCEFKTLFLKLKFHGEAVVEIKGSNRNAAFGLQNETISNGKYENGAIIEIPNFHKYEAIYFCIYEKCNAPIQLHSAEWCTQDNPLRQNKLAIVITTFKREKYVNDHIKKFNEFIEKDNKTDYRLIIVNNANNDDFQSASSKYVSIYKNINAGGAGGFARGIYEVIHNYPDIDRVIFMDDDVRLYPESFEKVLLLSNFLKDAYKSSFINGAMLDLYNGYQFFENLAIQNKFWVNPLISNLDLRNYENVLLANDIPDDIFEQPDRLVDSAWFFHCFSVDTAKTSGLPLPIFIRGDDVEWSWRRYGKKHISMNGICIWHSPFLWRVSKVTEYYYMTRNMFFIHLKYNKNFKREYENYLSETFNYLLKTYDYTSISLLFAAIRDVLKGTTVLREDPEKQFKAVNNINKNRETYTASQHEIDSMFGKKPFVAKRRKFLYKISHKGLLLPRVLFRKKGLAPDFFPAPEFFMLRKRVVVINPLSKSAEVRVFKGMKIQKLEKDFKLLLSELNSSYDNLLADVNQNFEKMMTMEFWKEYLKL